MADSVLFEVDASEIIAKLHLAGLQSIKIESGEFLVNTGIINDNPKAKPDDPGDVKFDLKNTSKEYEVGYAMTISYKKAFDLEDTIDSIADLLAKTSGDKSKLNDEAFKKSDDYKNLESSKAYVAKIFNSRNEKLADDDLTDPKKIKELKDKAKELVNADLEEYDKTISEAKEYCLVKISSYLKNFAGTANVKQFDATALELVDISSKAVDSTSSGLVKMYEIQPMSEQEKGKLISQFRANFKKDPSKANCTQKICCKVKYILNVDN